MKQKILSLIFIAIFGIAAKAQTIVESGDGWSLDSEGVLTITKDYEYSYSEKYPWYSSRNNVKSVVIAEGVTKIGKYAFNGYSNLKSVTIPEGVVSIGSSAFSGFVSINELHLGSVESYCNISFGSDSSSPLYSSSGVKLYVGAEEVTELVIPEGVTTINDNAFAGCSGLTSVAIPSSVISIGSSAFSGCKNINELHLGSVESWCNISFGNNSSNPLSSSVKVKLYVGNEEVKNLVIPTGVTSIGKSAFSGCYCLTSVTIPEGVKSIGEFAFYKCSGLTSVTIPSSVTSIDNRAFEECKKINELHLGSLESWCKISFGNSSSNPLYSTSVKVKLYVGNEEVKNLVIPTGVTSIGKYAFTGSYCLTSVTIPEGVKSIDESAFESCSGLTSVTIPEGVESIGESAFYNCSGLTSVTIPESVTCIGDYAFASCSGLTSVTISENVESIGESVFQNCSGLTSVTIPENVESIGESVFQNCSGLTSVTIPESVTSIGGYAFYNCLNLTSVSILSKGEVTYGTKFGETATFAFCENLKYVFLHQTEELVDIVSVFTTSVCKKIERFFVPDELLENYRSQYASNNDLKDKFTGFSMIEKRGENDTEEQVVALSLEKGSYDFITWAVNSGEQVREGEEISIALTEDFDLDAENVTWQALGTAEHPFKGIFEGNYLSVKGNHRANATQPKSIFGYIGEGAEIRNVVFSDFIVDATSAGVTDGGKTYYGLVARENKGLIRNSIFEGRMEIDADADDIENAEACLVIDNEGDGELDHVIGYFEGLDGEVTGNKTSIIVIQNIGHGRTRGHSKKTASNGKKKSKGNSTVSAEVPDDINLNYRLFTDEEFAGAEPAYWLNFDGEGYTGSFSGEWTQGTKHPVLAKGEHGATVGVKYNVVNRDESVLGPSPVFFATSKSSLEVEYSEKPLSIEVNGTEIADSQIGDTNAKFSLASVDTEKGNVNVVLKYEKQSTPTAVDDIDAAGSQKTIKTVENGRVVIIRDGKKYDLAGRVLSDKF